MAKKPEITVVFPVFNLIRRQLPGHDQSQWLKRIYYALHSIACNSYVPRVIIPDGSVKVNYDRLKHFIDIERFDFVRHVHLPQKIYRHLTALWNDGICLSETDYIFSTGADFIYKPDYFEHLRGEAAPLRYLVSEACMLPRTWIPTDEKIESWDVPECSPNGAGSVADGVVLFHKPTLSGKQPPELKDTLYDERIIGWGAMDNMMKAHAKHAGMKVEWIRRDGVYHIWHNTEKNKSRKDEAQFRANQLLLKKAKEGKAVKSEKLR